MMWYDSYLSGRVNELQFDYMNIWSQINPYIIAVTWRIEPFWYGNVWHHIMGVIGGDDMMYCL